MAIEQVEIKDTMPWGIRRIAGISPVRLAKYKDNGRPALQDLGSADTNTVAGIVKATAIQIHVLVSVNRREKYTVPSVGCSRSLRIYCRR
jgi:hypothetical protein